MQDPEYLSTELKQLRVAVAELYLGIKRKTRDEVCFSGILLILFSKNEGTSPEEEAEERDIILSLDSYVIIDYIKSSVDIILNLKFEEIEKRLLDKNNGGSSSLNNNDAQSTERRD